MPNMTGNETLVENPPAHEISSQLRVLCRSETLSRSKRGKDILRYLVNAVIHKEPEEAFKGTVIGLEVFGLPADHDHATDPIVRVAMGDLRKKLAVYYETEGQTDSIRMIIPVGSYIPSVFYAPTVVSLKLSNRAAMCVVNARSASDQRTMPGFQAAIDYLNIALNEHPDHPRLLSLKALVHAMRAMYGAVPGAEIETAKYLIDRARQQGYELWELCVAEAEIYKALYFDWEGADQLFNRALELSHGESRYNNFYSSHLAAQLRLEEFLEIKRNAVSHFAYDSVNARCALAIAQIFLKQYEEAENTIRETLALFPAERYMSLVHLAMIHEAREEFKLAAEVIENIAIPLKESALTAGVRGLMAGLAGNRGFAAQVHQELLDFRRTGTFFIPASQLANSAMGIELYDEAAEWFRVAVLEERDPMMNWIAIIPFERHLRGHANFRDLVTRTMKLRFPDG
jgi:tetratricopeptide (TPR) repeat protein